MKSCLTCLFYRKHWYLSAGRCVESRIMKPITNPQARNCDGFGWMPKSFQHPASKPRPVTLPEWAGHA